MQTKHYPNLQKKIIQSMVRRVNFETENLKKIACHDFWETRKIWRTEIWRVTKQNSFYAFDPEWQVKKTVGCVMHFKISEDKCLFGYAN